MIEQIVIGFGFYGVGLESNQTNERVFQKVFPDLPGVSTFRTDFKRIHFQVFFSRFSLRFSLMVFVGFFLISFLVSRGFPIFSS
jgi:hypothetical protein